MFSAILKYLLYIALILLLVLKVIQENLLFNAHFMNFLVGAGTVVILQNIHSRFTKRKKAKAEALKFTEEEDVA
jgi:hypothetical protein